MKRIALALCVLSVMAVAAPPATEFKGLLIGQRLDVPAFRKQWKGLCHPVATGQQCRALTTIAGAKSEMVLQLDKAGTLQQLSHKFASMEYQPISTALREKFGAPTKAYTNEMQNGYGARFSAETQFWVLPDGVEVILAERGYSASEGLVAFTSKAEAAAGRQPEGARKRDL